MMTIQEARENVARGALLLDRVKPGWEQCISTHQLELETCDKCVLGQLYGFYAQGVMDLWPEGGYMHWREQTALCGFDRPLYDRSFIGNYSSSSYVLLREAWTALILARRETTVREVERELALA